MTVVSLDTHRAAKIGGSEAAAACGVNPYESRIALWYRKTQGIEREATETMRWGTLLEPVVFQELERQGFDVMPAPADGFTADALPWLIGHPDGFVALGGERGVLEIKTTGQWSAADWHSDAGAPLPVLVQTHHYMMLTDTGVALVACLIGGQRLEVRTLERDDDALVAILDREREMVELIAKGEPPEVDGSNSAHETIMAMHPSANGETIRFDKSTMQLVREARELHEQRDVIDRQYKEHVQKIQLAMGDAEHAISPFDTPAARWPTVNATRLDTSALKAARPDVYSEFAVSKPTRRFTLE